jgi:hypothetical protein
MNRRGCCLENVAIDEAAHRLVALAGRFLQLCPVDFDVASMIQSDGAKLSQLFRASVIVVRRTPSNCASASWVSGIVLLSIPSWIWSSHRASRASTGCNALQAATCWSCASRAIAWVWTICRTAALWLKAV